MTPMKFKNKENEQLFIEALKKVRNLLQAENNIIIGSNQNITDVPQSEETNNLYKTFNRVIDGIEANSVFELDLDNPMQKMWFYGNTNNEKDLGIQNDVEVLTKQNKIKI